MNSRLARNLLYYPATAFGGERVRHYLKEYISRDKLGSKDIRDLQDIFLTRILEHATQASPFYAQHTSSRSGPSSNIPQLSGFPLLEKQDLRSKESQLVAHGASSRAERKTTSGSTGNPVTVLKDRDALARERAATWRAYAWAGISVAAPQALLWGIPHTRSGRIRARALDFLANRKRLPMFGVTDVELDQYYHVLCRFRPHYLYGYVSAIRAFIEYIDGMKRALPRSLKCIITTSELLDSESRTFIQEASGLRVFNEYGCGEVGSIAHECEAGNLHVMNDNLIVECLPTAGLPDGLGEIVVTDLHNMAMPLIRYRLGDLGALSEDFCACGKPYQLLKRVVGRAYDIIFDINDKAYHPESVLYVLEDLRRSGVSLPRVQAVQTRSGQLALRFQAAERLEKSMEDQLRKSFSGAFGESMAIDFEYVSKLERELSGKLRVVKREARVSENGQC